ncbi:MAG: ABC transporter ATP-binding protein, partial [Pseudomonadota bacterium]
KLMAKPSNLLILDEPTNDFDVETLDLLQDILGEYDGTVLLVSHDRDFLDRVATATVAFEGRGRLTVYAGGWSDYQAQKQTQAAPKPKPQVAPPKTAQETKKEQSSSLTFTELHRLDELPAEIDRLTAEIAKLEDFLAQPDLYAAEPLKFQKGTEALVSRQEALAAAEEEWLTLEEKKESAA